MHLVARVGAARIGIVHGDAASLAGWGFAHERLDYPGHRRWIASAFREARVDVFASSHTCLPALRRFETARRAGGRQQRRGRHAQLRRHALRPPHAHLDAAAAPGPCTASRSAGVHVQAVPIDYDAERWRLRFLAQWPAGSPAHASYFRRIIEGPRLALAEAAPRTLSAA